VISDERPPLEDPFGQVLQRAEASVDESDTPAGRRELGGLYYIDDRFEDAQHQWEIAFRMFRDSGQLCDAARTAIKLAGLHSNVYGQVAAGGGWAERARMLLERVGPCVEWGYLELASVACDRTDIDDLLASADRALAIATDFGDVDLEAQALADGGLALVTRGSTNEGIARLDAALAAISAGEVSPMVAGICFCSMLTACDRTGDVRRVQEWTGIVAGMIRGFDNRPRILHTHCRVAYGSVLHAAGRWPEAEASLLEALGPVDSPTRPHRDVTVAHLAGLRIEQGRLEEAAELLAPFEDRVNSCLPLAQIHLRRDAPDLAVAVLQRGLRELVADGLRIGPLLALLVVAELQRGDADAAGEAADRLEQLAAEVDVVALRADGHVARARILSATGDDAAAIARFRQAAETFGNDERPLLLATVRHEMAEALARSGDVAGAVAEARAALACFERLGADAHRDRVAALLRSLGDTARARPQRADDVATALSAREREVLELVRHGLSNAEIASRLFISPKTAEHHVGRILTKLGVRSRGEAAALAVRLAASGRE
jgi:DNA-binding NarL/FixJ family response regulator